MEIAKNLSLVLDSIPDGVKLVAISKMKSEKEILEAYQAGHRVFGENMVQELLKKQEVLPNDIEWHMVGHLQSNKVKYIAPFVHLIHSVDTLKLLKIINKEAAKNNRNIDCLLQVHIAREETKFGFSNEELIDMLDSGEWKELRSIRIIGLMGMATFTKNEELIRSEFKSLKAFFDEIKKRHFEGETSFSVLSMGMSDDFIIAIEEGSTMVRIGSLIFKERQYH
jgi:pyridoxal phosphate enzyme (YggS family)